MAGELLCQAKHIMGIFGQLLTRPLSQDRFAQMLIKRRRPTGEAGQILYDRGEFRLCKWAGRELFLNNSYFLFLASFAAILTASMTRAPASEVADLVLFNGKIATVDKEFNI